MSTLNDLLQLARICREQAKTASSPEVATELRRLADGYDERATQLAFVGSGVIDRPAKTPRPVPQQKTPSKRDRA